MGGFLATVGTLFILVGVILIFALEVITDVQIGIIVCAFGFGFVLWGTAGAIWRLGKIRGEISSLECYMKQGCENRISPSMHTKESFQEGLWICRCGRRNYGYATCVCGVNKQELFDTNG